MSRSEIEAIVNQVQRLSPEEQTLVVCRITGLLARTKPEILTSLMPKCLAPGAVVLQLPRRLRARGATWFTANTRTRLAVNRPKKISSWLNGIQPRNDMQLVCA
ncbi:hypothetical protein BH20ACI3_BH20ACI3_16550 [soil metagenome]